MRLGIFGGTFDPVHIGHLVAAQVSLEQAGLDKVLFMPAGVNPLKVGRSIREGKDRLAMVRLAIEGAPKFEACDWELTRPGPSFTVDTLEHFQQLYPQAELFLIIGADNLQILPKWRAVDRILEIATILAVTRPGFDLTTSAETVLALRTDLSDRVRYVDIPGLNISSTCIRERMLKNLSVEHLVPSKVIRYSKENSLYERIGD